MRGMFVRRIKDFNEEQKHKLKEWTLHARLVANAGIQNTSAPEGYSFTTNHALVPAKSTPYRGPLANATIDIDELWNRNNVHESEANEEEHMDLKVRYRR